MFLVSVYIYIMSGGGCWYAYLLTMFCISSRDREFEKWSFDMDVRCIALRSWIWIFKMSLAIYFEFRLDI